MNIADVKDKGGEGFSSYKIWVRCQNCGSCGEIVIASGHLVAEERCRTCWCKTLVRNSMGWRNK